MKVIRNLFMGLFCIGFTFLTVIPSASAARTPIQYMMKRMNYMQGTWYGVENPYDTVTFNGGLFNGKQIVGFENLAGGGGDFGCTMVVQQDGEERNIALNAQNLGSVNNPYHQYLRINNILYTRSQTPLYGESVGGIFLGMPVAQVVELYGQPDLTEKQRSRVIYAYTKLGMMLDIRDKIVQQIRIFSLGDRKLDTTLLDCNSSLDEFKEAYGLSEVNMRGANSIGKGEYLWFNEYPQSIVLSLYWN